MRSLHLRFLAYTALVAGSLALSGCAAAISTNKTGTTIATNPAGATCVLEGQRYKQTIQTPQSVLLLSESKPIWVTCEKDGYATTRAMLTTQGDDWLVANYAWIHPFIIVPAMLMDVGRSAGEHYPRQVNLAMMPVTFQTAYERDLWYQERRLDLEAAWEKKRRARLTHCGSAANCQLEAEKLASGKARDLQELERLRAMAVVAQL